MAFAFPLDQTMDRPRQQMDLTLKDDEELLARLDRGRRRAREPRGADEAARWAVKA